MKLLNQPDQMRAWRSSLAVSPSLMLQLAGRFRLALPISFFRLPGFSSKDGDSGPTGWLRRFRACIQSGELMTITVIKTITKKNGLQSKARKYWSGRRESNPR
ncbi:hypothetical protein, partial [Pseudomonas aeruginosa]|uniref:hypothetical protein n=1 Tax=Pseudomonas aeruginosa TaxID=287 RepID=UPI001ABCEBAB